MKKSVRSHLRLRIGLILAATLMLGACLPFQTDETNSDRPDVLQPVRMEHESVVLDVYILRIPHAEAGTLERLWWQVDEMHFAPEVRRIMTKYGFRAGVAGIQPPAALSQLMDLKNKPAPANEPLLSTAGDLTEEPTMLWARHQIRPGRRVELQVSERIDRLPILEWKNGALVGDTLDAAQAMVAVEGEPRGRGLLLRLTPELRYGAPEVSFSGNQGLLRWQVEPKRRVFDGLVVEARLLPGEILVFGATRDCSTAVSRHFFQNDSAKPGERKLLVIRLAQTQHDDLFDASAVMQGE